MSSASPSHILVSHKYGIDEHLPEHGEIIVIRLSEDLFGPGSVIESTSNLPSHATRKNYHHAVILRAGLQVGPGALVHFTVLPMPAYSFPDPVSGLSSTSWLLDQANDFQQRHIPVPHEEAPILMQQPYPTFPTPAKFGDPLQIGGWKHDKPIWVQTVPQVASFKYTTTVNICNLLKGRCNHTLLTCSGHSSNAMNPQSN
jgi:hypothetical protein